MKVRIGREELLTACSACRVSWKTEHHAHPLEYSVGSQHDGAEIVATDLELGMRGLYKASVLEAGGVTISARKLYEIIKGIAQRRDRADFGDNNWTTIQSARASSRSSACRAVIIPRCHPLNARADAVGRGGTAGVDP